MSQLTINNVKHLGVILEPSTTGFDKSAATFGSLLKEDDITYLFYTGSIDTKWSQASIGIAVSNDGIKFTKKKEPLVTLGREAVTPAVFKALDSYWMVFSSSTKKGGRQLKIAQSDDPLGPWKIIKDLIKPEKIWEGMDIDIGTCVVPMGNNEFLIYYSNVSNHPLSRLVSQNYKLRRIGILSIKIKGAKQVEVNRWHKNPLKHLNGDKNSWNESIFCPGYFNLGNKHYLLPSASTYSIKFPYKQYIGLVEDTSPYFTNPSSYKILIDGPKEKSDIITNIKNEIGLDTPYPFIVDNNIWLYYAVMDRYDEVWKTALSIYSISY